MAGFGEQGGEETSFGVRIHHHQILLGVYVFVAAIQLIYAFARALNLLRAILSTRCFTNNPDKDEAGRIPAEQEPAVTIQICTYNEGMVVDETIKCACSVDWPKDKLYVQVLDDSTDPASRRIVEEAVSRWHNDYGINIVRLSRPDRVGYKGGSLRYHFEKNLHTTYVAQFDADHRMEPDFLRRVMPFFYDRQGNEKSNIGLVQAPWAYYNIHQNLLTEADALGLDIHHVNEQQGRGAYLRVFGFNGTGGVWRKSAIADAGGWSWETVTEDLALSYDAFCAGYDFVYVRTCPQVLECPSGILAHIQQKHRWTKGFLQVLRLSYRQLLFSPRASIFVKIEAFFHMTGSSQFFWCAVLLILHPLISYHGLDNDTIRALTVAPTMIPLIEAFITVFVKVSSSKGEYKSFASRLTRLVFVLPFFAIKNGMSFFEFRAIIDGLTSNDATFLATPKEGLSSSVTTSKLEQELASVYEEATTESKLQSKSANTADSSLVNVAIAWAGILVAIYRLLYFVIYDISMKVTSITQLWFHTMNFCVCVGYFYIGGSYLYASLFEQRRKSMICIGSAVSCWLRSGCRQRFSSSNTRVRVPQRWTLKPFQATRQLRYFTPPQLQMVTMTVILAFYAALVMQHNATIIQLRNRISSPFRPDFSCPVSFPGGARTHKLFVVFGQPRTGSNALFDILAQLGEVANPKQLELTSLYELFLSNHTKSQAYRIASVGKLMSSVCDIKGMNDVEKKEWTNLDSVLDVDEDPLTYMNAIEELSTESWQKEIIELFRRHGTDSHGLLQLLHTIPSWSLNPYFAFKVFDFHLRVNLAMTAKDFVQSLTDIAGLPNVQVAVLWRRRLIEGFVSSEFASLSGKWSTTDKGKKGIPLPRKLNVRRDKLEKYIQKQRHYYKSVVAALVEGGMTFEVLEYETDLRDDSQQIETAKKLLRVLGVPTKQVDVDQIFEKGLQFSKQSNSTVDMYVENWQDVVDWGYGGETAEWPDFLEAHPIHTGGPR